MAPEASFVLKRGEGLHNTNMIKHKVLHVETRGASSVESSPKIAPLSGPHRTKPVKTSYVSPMQRARREKKQQLEAGLSKDWDETSSASPSSDMSGSTASSKPARVIPYSGNLIPSSGYIAKPRESVSEGLGGSGRLPKFGAWDNQDDASSPCYTLLFENVAQEKRIGGPIRVHANRPASPGRTEDLYSYNPDAIKARKNRLQLHHSLLRCFVGS